MSNYNWTGFFQSNVNYSDHDSTATSLANSGGNAVIGGLIGINAANPATATTAALNFSPVTQSNVATDWDSIEDIDL